MGPLFIHSLFAYFKAILLVQNTFPPSLFLPPSPPHPHPPSSPSSPLPLSYVIIAFRAFEKYSPMNILYQPAMRVQTEPQKQRGVKGPDFAFFRVSDHSNNTWLYPIIEEPVEGSNVSFNLS